MCNAPSMPCCLTRLPPVARAAFLSRLSYLQACVLLAKLPCSPQCGHVFSSMVYIPALRCGHHAMPPHVTQPPLSPPDAFDAAQVRCSYARCWATPVSVHASLSLGTPSSTAQTPTDHHAINSTCVSMMHASHAAVSPTFPTPSNQPTTHRAASHRPFPAPNPPLVHRQPTLNQPCVPT